MNERPEQNPKPRLQAVVVARVMSASAAARRRAVMMSQEGARFAQRHLTEDNFDLVVRTVVTHREIALAATALCGWIVESIWPANAPGAMAVITSSLIAIPVSIYFRVEAGIRAKITELVMPHQRELSVKRQQLYRKGSFGLVEDKAWRKEVERFLDFIVAPRVNLKMESRREWARALVNHVAMTAPVVEGFHPGMAPVEYENLVARALRAHGWSADTTKGSGDQGVDVLAHKGRFRLVVQCKLYSNSVGNAAVQEAISAREWENATHAAVVTNAAYTKAAKALAHKAGVLLLHHDELPVAEARCGSLPAHVVRRPGAAA